MTGPKGSAVFGVFVFTDLVGMGGVGEGAEGVGAGLPRGGGYGVGVEVGDGGLAEVGQGGGERVPAVAAYEPENGSAEFGCLLRRKRGVGVYFHVI